MGWRGASSWAGHRCGEGGFDGHGGEVDGEEEAEGEPEDDFRFEDCGVEEDELHVEHGAEDEEGEFGGGCEEGVGGDDESVCGAAETEDEGCEHEDWSGEPVIGGDVLDGGLEAFAVEELGLGDGGDADADDEVEDCVHEVLLGGAEGADDAVAGGLVGV